MTSIEAAQVLSVLSAAFPQVTISKETTELYARLLTDIPFEAGKKAALAAVAESRFFPSVAEIRERATFGGQDSQDIRRRAKDCHRRNSGCSINTHNGICEFCPKWITVSQPPGKAITADTRTEEEWDDARKKATAAIAKMSQKLKMPEST